MWTRIRSFLRQTRGLESVEWAIVAAVVVLAGAALWTLIGQDVQGAVGRIGDAVPETSPGGGRPPWAGPPGGSPPGNGPPGGWPPEGGTPGG